MALQQRGNLAEAQRLYRHVLMIEPDNFDALHMLGVSHLQAGNAVAAVEAFDGAIRRNERSADAHFNRALALCSLKRFEAAIVSLDRVVSIEPKSSDAHNNRGLVLRELGRLPEAVESFDAAIAVAPRAIEAHYNKANALAALGNLDRAVAAYDMTLSLRPDHVMALLNRGMTLRDLRRFDDALASFDKAAALAPKSVAAHNNRGLALTDLDRHGEALQSYDTVLSLDPNHADAQYNRGNALNELGRLEEALTSLDRAAALTPDAAQVHNNRGLVLRELNCHKESIAAFDKALAVKPGDPDILCSRGLTALALADFETGWEGYAQRFEMQKPVGRVAGVVDSIPAWNGEPLTGRSILIHEEQGLGDIIQFCRFLPILAERGARVTFLVASKLHRLLATLPAEVRLLSELPLEETFDFQSPLLSLPRSLGTSLTSIPACVPYLAADPAAVERWRQRVGGDGLRIGIAWQGNAKNRIDRGRSLALRAFAPLAAIPGIRLLSLQKGGGAEQLADLPPGMSVETLGADFDAGPDAFVDTAAVMAGLELVVSCDTSIVHLAGALGRPVWIALRHVPDWRWLLDRTDSPWYPTARLYRQTTRDDWSDVFERIACDAAALVKQRAEI